MQTVSFFTFHDNENNISSGTPYRVQNSEKILTFEVSGDSTSRELIFEGAGLSGEYLPLKCINLTTYKSNTGTVGTGELWEVGLHSIISFRVRIISISGGSVTVKAKVVS